MILRDVIFLGNAFKRELGGRFKKGIILKMGSFGRARMAEISSAEMDAADLV